MVLSSYYSALIIQSKFEIEAGLMKKFA